MTDLKIYIQRKQANKTAWIWPSQRTGNNEQQYLVFYEGREIGSWACPEHDAARWLIAQGFAQRSDRLVSFRRYEDRPDEPSMTSGMGWLADRTMIEDDNGPPRLAKYMPFPAKGFSTGSASGRGEVE